MKLRVPSKFASTASAIVTVFRVPGLRRLGFGYLASLTGMWAYAIAADVYAFGIGGVALVGLTAVIRLVPAAILAPFTAAVADRYPRRRVLIATDLGRCLLILAGLALIVAELPVAVFAVAGVGTVLSTMFEPAKNAMLPALAQRPEQLTAANAVMSSFESAGIFIGPAVGGAVLALASIEAAYACAALLLICSAVLVARIDPDAAQFDESSDPSVQRTGEAAGGESGETDAVARGDEADNGALAGFRTVLGDVHLRLVIGLVALQVLICGATGVLMIPFAIDVLGIGGGGVGMLNAVVGVGGLAGAAAAVALAGWRGAGVVLALSIAFWGAPYILIGAFAILPVAIVALFITGVANTVVDTTSLTLIQRLTPDAVRARVFGVFESLMIGGLALGCLLAPALERLIGVEAGLVALGCVLPVAALATATTLRQIDEASPAPHRRLELLRGVPMLSPLGSFELEQLAGALEPMRFAAGSTVVRQGEKGDYFFLIDSGEVTVHEDDRLARREGPGEYFGEIALLRDVPRTATVTAIGELQLFALGREEFIAAVSGHDSGTEAADMVIAARINSTRRVPYAAF